MGCHFCADEMFAIFAIMGGIKYLPRWIMAMWTGRHQKPICHHKLGHKGARR